MCVRIFLFCNCLFKTEFLVPGAVPEFKPTILYVMNLNELSNYRLTSLFLVFLISRTHHINCR